MSDRAERAERSELEDYSRIEREFERVDKENNYFYGSIRGKYIIARIRMKVRLPMPEEPDTLHTPAELFNQKVPKEDMAHLASAMKSRSVDLRRLIVDHITFSHLKLINKISIDWMVCNDMFSTSERSYRNALYAFTKATHTERSKHTDKYTMLFTTSEEIKHDSYYIGSQFTHIRPYNEVVDLLETQSAVVIGMQHCTSTCESIVQYIFRIE